MLKVLRVRWVLGYFNFNLSLIIGTLLLLLFYNIESLKDNNKLLFMIEIKY